MRFELNFEVDELKVIQEAETRVKFQLAVKIEGCHCKSDLQCISHLVPACYTCRIVLLYHDNFPAFGCFVCTLPVHI